MSVEIKIFRQEAGKAGLAARDLRLADKATVQVQPDDRIRLVDVNVLECEFKVAGRDLQVKVPNGEQITLANFMTEDRTQPAAEILTDDPRLLQYILDQIVTLSGEEGIVPADDGGDQFATYVSPLRYGDGVDLSDVGDSGDYSANRLGLGDGQTSILTDVEREIEEPPPPPPPPLIPPVAEDRRFSVFMSLRAGVGNGSLSDRYRIVAVQDGEDGRSFGTDGSNSYFQALAAPGSSGTVGYIVQAENGLTDSATITLDVVNTANLNQITAANPSVLGLRGARFFGEGAGAIFGNGLSVSNIGDINRDGLDDFIIGSPQSEQGGLNNNGATYVVYGRADGFANGDFNLANIGQGGSLAGFKLVGSAANVGIGRNVGGAGDFNGDGELDFLIGSVIERFTLPSGRLTGGPISVVLGGSDLNTIPVGANRTLQDIGALGRTIILTGTPTNDLNDVHSLGDINGDGIDDVVGTVLFSASGNTDSYVFFGSRTAYAAGGVQAQLGADPEIFASRISNGGSPVRGAGDMNGDGVNDFWLASENGNGRVGLSLGGTDISGQVVTAPGFGGAGVGVGLPIALTISGVAGGVGQPGRFGATVASAGDFNGDGFDDVILPGSGLDGRVVDTGAVFIVNGGAGLGGGGNFTTADIGGAIAGFRINGERMGDQFGSLVASAGDINGDGFDDLLIGAAGADGGAGATYLVFGTGVDLNGQTLEISDLLRLGLAFRLDGEGTGNRAGSAVSAAGDVNGDGLADLLIGADRYSGAAQNQGATYLLLGGDYTASITHQGGAGNDLLAGTAGADNMVGGQGNDVLIGNGGLDVIYGGADDDVIRLRDGNGGGILAGSDFARIDGGNGFDVLAMDGAGNLDLTAIADNRLQNIEAIDLRNGAGNVLTLSASDLFNLSDTSAIYRDAALGTVANSLIVRGEAGDQVTFTDLAAGHLFGTAAGYDWHDDGQVMIDGIAYDRWNYRDDVAGDDNILGGVFVQNGVTVNAPAFARLADSAGAEAEGAATQGFTASVESVTASEASNLAREQDLALADETIGAPEIAKGAAAAVTANDATVSDTAMDEFDRVSVPNRVLIGEAIVISDQATESGEVKDSDLVPLPDLSVSIARADLGGSLLIGALAVDLQPVANAIFGATITAPFALPADPLQEKAIAEEPAKVAPLPVDAPATSFASVVQALDQLNNLHLQAA